MKSTVTGVLSLLQLDADHFKQINDSEGHAADDEILKGLVKLWKSDFRSRDLIAGIGGEEFCVVLPEAGPDEAARHSNSVSQINQ